jgi:hypothetical protein
MSHLKYYLIFKSIDSYLLFRYAFISHRSSKEAQRNLQRPIDYILLGDECHVEHAGDTPSRSNTNRHCDERTIVVKNIPEYVTENDLSRLFINCYISRYCPARTVHRMNTSKAITTKTKTFWG